MNVDYCATIDVDLYWTWSECNRALVDQCYQLFECMSIKPLHDGIGQSDMSVIGNDCMQQFVRYLWATWSIDELRNLCNRGWMQVNKLWSLWTKKRNKETHVVKAKLKRKELRWWKISMCQKGVRYIWTICFERLITW